MKKLAEKVDICFGGQGPLLLNKGQESGNASIKFVSTNITFVSVFNHRIGLLPIIHLYVSENFPLIGSLSRAS